MYEIWQMCTMGECEPLEPFIKEFESDDMVEVLSEKERLEAEESDIIYQIYQK